MEAFKDCGICFVSYDTKDHAPRFLPCGHTLCSHCLVDTITRPALRKCPFDNASFGSSQNSLASFPLNFALLSLLEQKNSDICNDHPGERLKLICLTDNLKICSECAKHEDHKGHRIKKIKQLKTQGAKVKRDLQENLLRIRDNEQNKENDYEDIKKVFICTIDEQFKEIKEILAEKQFELVQQAKNLFDADKKGGSEAVFMLEQQMDETIKDITHACNNDNGDLILLDKAISNDQILVKSQLLKEKPGRIRNRVGDMQKLLRSSLDASKMAINSLQLPSEEFIKETYLLQKEGEGELAKIHKGLQSIKFNSDFDIKMTSEDLKISIGDIFPNIIEINRDEIKKLETIEIQFKGYDVLFHESQPNILSFILCGLEKFTSLEVSFSPVGFSLFPLSWLGERFSDNFQRLRFLSLDFEKCKISGPSMDVLCDRILSKIMNLRDFYLYLNSSQTNSTDLERLVNTLRPFQKNFECFALGLASNTLTDDAINQVFEMIKNMEQLKSLQLILSGTRITNRSLETFGEFILARLKALDSLTLCVNKTQISDQGIVSVFKNLPNLKRLELYLSQTRITNNTLDVFLAETLPRLASLKSLTFIANANRVGHDNLQKIRKISESLKKKMKLNKDSIQL